MGISSLYVVLHQCNCGHLLYTHARVYTHNSRTSVIGRQGKDQACSQNPFCLRITSVSRLEGCRGLTTGKGVHQGCILSPCLFGLFYPKDRIAMDFLHLQRGNCIKLDSSALFQRGLVLSQGKGGISPGGWLSSIAEQVGEVPGTGVG